MNETYERTLDVLDESMRDLKKFVGMINNTGTGNTSLSEITRQYLTLRDNITTQLEELQSRSESKPTAPLKCISCKTGTLQCARCKTTIYCCRECQKNDWAGHRIVCRKSTI